MSSKRDRRIEQGLNPDEPSEYMDWAFLGLFRDRPAWRSGEAAKALDVRDGAPSMLSSTCVTTASFRSRREALRGADEVRWN
jgi:hypothetical protein